VSYVREAMGSRCLGCGGDGEYTGIDERNVSTEDGDAHHHRVGGRFLGSSWAGKQALDGKDQGGRGA
jgi:hypothetical protein